MGCLFRVDLGPSQFQFDLAGQFSRACRCRDGIVTQLRERPSVRIQPRRSRLREMGIPRVLRHQALVVLPELFPMFIEVRFRALGRIVRRRGRELEELLVVPVLGQRQAGPHQRDHRERLAGLPYAVRPEVIGQIRPPFDPGRGLHRIGFRVIEAVREFLRELSTSQFEVLDLRVRELRGVVRAEQDAVFGDPLVDLPVECIRLGENGLVIPPRMRIRGEFVGPTGGNLEVVVRGLRGLFAGEPINDLAPAARCSAATARRRSRSRAEPCPSRA